MVGRHRGGGLTATGAGAFLTLATGLLSWKYMPWSTQNATMTTSSPGKSVAGHFQTLLESSLDTCPIGSAPNTTYSTSTSVPLPVCAPLVAPSGLEFWFKLLILPLITFLSMWLSYALAPSVYNNIVGLQELVPPPVRGFGQRCNEVYYEYGIYLEFFDLLLGKLTSPTVSSIMTFLIVSFAAALVVDAPMGEDFIQLKRKARHLQSRLIERLKTSVKFERLAKQFYEELSHLRGLHNGLTFHANSLQIRIDKLQDQIKDLRTHNAGLEKLVKDLKSRIAALEDRNNGLEKQINDLENQIRDLNGTIWKLKDEVARLKEENEGHESTLDYWYDKVEEMSKTIGRLEHEKKQLKNERDRLLEELNATKKELKATKSELYTAHQEKKRAEAEKDDAIAELNDTKQELEATKSDLEEKNEHLREYEQELQGAEDEIKALKLKLKEQHGSTNYTDDELKRALNEAKKEKEKAVAERNLVRKQAKELEAKQQQHLQDVAKHEARSKEYDARIAAAESEKEQAVQERNAMEELKDKAESALSEHLSKGKQDGVRTTPSQDRTEAKKTRDGEHARWTRDAFEGGKEGEDEILARPVDSVKGNQRTRLKFMKKVIRQKRAKMEEQ